VEEVLMAATFTHRDGTPVAHPQGREHNGEKFYVATEAELASPEWVSKFTLNNPGVKIVRNRPVKVSRG
jgi:hypothetical protein